ncbi:MAG: hypothetical protein IJ035_08700 [Oscillospiraceae bacterium]|nr:hypothetical protein [Oscillospiraceae bacterium]
MSNLNSSPRRGQMMEIHCPNCGRLVGTFVVGDYRYGSPLKICKKCKTEYINPAVHEIEVDGISPDAFDMKRLLIGILVGIVFIIIGAAIFYFEVTRKGYYHTSTIAIMVISAIAIFYALGNIFFIKTGIKAKWTERKRQESAERMSNPEYALRLKEHGYNVPEKYLPQEYAEK